MNNKKEAAVNDNFLYQTESNSDKDISIAKDYLKGAENFLHTILEKNIELEEENNIYRIKKLKTEAELVKIKEELAAQQKKADMLEKEHEKLTDKLKEIEEKYLKEQKKSNLLELENSRNIDELKVLRKEKNILLQKNDKNKTSMKDRIKLIISGEDKH